jgi:positive regulator of sigma E activity
MWRRIQTQRLRCKLGGTVPGIGSSVSVSIPERNLLYGALAVHGAPLAGLLLGALIGMLAIGGDLGTLAGAVLGIAGTYMLTFAMRRRMERVLVEEMTLSEH